MRSTEHNINSNSTQHPRLTQPSILHGTANQCKPLSEIII